MGDDEEEEPHLLGTSTLIHLRAAFASRAATAAAASFAASRADVDGAAAAATALRALAASASSQATAHAEVLESYGLPVFEEAGEAAAAAAAAAEAAGEEGAGADGAAGEEEGEDAPDTAVVDALTAAAERERAAAGVEADGFGRAKAVAAAEGLDDLADWFQDASDASVRLGGLLDKAAAVEAAAAERADA